MMKNMILVLVTILTVSCHAQLQQAHLQDWYAKDPVTLTRNLETYRVQARKHFPVVANPQKVRALLVPHAGHSYSGLCAMTAYQTLTKPHEAQNSRIKRVIILAPSHHIPITGIALPNYDAYQTPLGTIPVDVHAVNTLRMSPLFAVHKQVHQVEHSLEVQLPFLQHYIARFAMIPLIVGDMNANQLKRAAQALAPLIDDTTLIVATTDLTHHGASYGYEPFKEHTVNRVKAVDSLALEPIMEQSLKRFISNIQKTGITMCGKAPVKLLLELMNQGKLGTVHARLTGYYTSAHQKQSGLGTSAFIADKLIGTVPDSHVDQVVGYPAVIFSLESIESLKREDQLTGYEKQALIVLGREAIENALTPAPLRIKEALLWPIRSPGMKLNRGAFVTLYTKSDHQLRGCIGRFTSTEPLYKTVAAMAKAAAFEDTRFTPVTPQEWPDITTEITVLADPKPIKNINEIKLGRDGIILNKRNTAGIKTHSAVFLPRVPIEFGWDLKTTLEQLSEKAELGKDGWKELSVSFETFEGYDIWEDPNEALFHQGPKKQPSRNVQWPPYVDHRVRGQ